MKNDFIRAIGIVLAACLVFLGASAYRNAREDKKMRENFLQQSIITESSDSVPDGWTAIGFDNDGNPIKWTDNSGATWSSAGTFEHEEKIQNMAFAMPPFHKSAYIYVDDDGYIIEYNVTVSDWIFADDTDRIEAVLYKLGSSKMRMPKNAELHYWDNMVEI